MGKKKIKTENNLLIYNLHTLSLMQIRKFQLYSFFLCIIFNFQQIRSLILFNTLIIYMLSHNLFSYYQTMSEFNLQNILIRAIINEQNPIISLYLLKKSIQQDLIREIQINCYFQSIIRTDNQSKQKFQPKSADIHKQITTESKVKRLISKSRKKINIRKLKNDTKNIPKNFGKAIITFVEQNEEVMKKFLSNECISYEVFLQALRNKKKGINSIADLRSLWLDQQFKYARQMRAISTYFLKRGSLSYVFSSRITNHKGHIKYRNRLIQVLKQPHQFTSIKTG